MHPEKTTKIRAYSAESGQRTKKKRTGVVATALRVPAPLNVRLHKAAKTVGLSFNGWANRVLEREADEILNNPEKRKTLA